jgi:hypothetical protein
VEHGLYVGETRSPEQPPGEGMRIVLRTEVAVVLDYDRASGERRETLISQDLPFPALDVHLDQVDALEEGEDVPHGNGDVTVSLVCDHVRRHQRYSRPARGKACFSVPDSRAGLAQSPLVATSVQLDAAGGKPRVLGVGLESDDPRLGPLAKKEKREKPDVGAEVGDLERAERVQYCPYGVRERVGAADEDLLEGERIPRAVTKEHRHAVLTDAIATRPGFLAERSKHVQPGLVNRPALPDGSLDSPNEAALSEVSRLPKCQDPSQDSSGERVGLLLRVFQEAIIVPSARGRQPRLGHPEVEMFSDP